MENETLNLSNTLKELAELKAECELKKEQLKTLQDILSDDEVEETWRNSICWANLDHTHLDYVSNSVFEPFENENLQKVKDKYYKKEKELKDLVKNKPNQKPIMKYKFELFDFINGFLLVFFAAILIAAICSNNIPLYIFAPIILIGTLLYTFLRKQPIAQIKEHKEYKKQNAENAEWNETTYIKLVKEYDDKKRSLSDELERIIDKELPIAIRECIVLAKEREKPLRAEIAKLIAAMANEKFNIYSISKYSATQLETMAEYLDTGRASDYKEALNLYLQEKAEREHREGILRLELRQAEETRRHNEQMEESAREAAYQAKVAADAAKRQEEHAKTAAQAAKSQEEIARQEFLSKCRTCKHTCLNIKNCKGYEKRQ